MTGRRPEGLAEIRLAVALNGGKNPEVAATLADLPARP
jgi:hypothetical protein